MTAETTTPSETTLYWHSLPVVCLNFTTEGSFLLSGGHECVLVKWMYKKSQKEFLSILVSLKNLVVLCVQISI